METTSQLSLPWQLVWREKVKCGTEKAKSVFSCSQGFDSSRHIPDAVSPDSRIVLMEASRLVCPAIHSFFNVNLLSRRANDGSFVVLTDVLPHFLWLGTLI